MHLILCNWLPFYRPCSFASQTFIWFADFLIIALILCKKLILLYFNAQLYTRKIYRFNARKTKKNSRYIYPNCSSTSEVHAALTLLFPAHLYSDRSISLELLSVFLSDSLNYLPEKTAIMSRFSHKDVILSAIGSIRIKKYKDTFVSAKVIFVYIVFIIS